MMYFFILIDDGFVSDIKIFKDFTKYKEYVLDECYKYHIEIDDVRNDGRTSVFSSLKEMSVSFGLLDNEDLI